MNGYLLGLALVIVWLCLQTLGHHMRFKALIKAIGAITELLAATSGIPEKQIQEAKSIWDEAKAAAERSVAISSCVVLAAVVFLVVLVVRGHL